MNFLPRGSWPLSAGVYITGQTPSLSPLDRAASFTRHEEISDVTYREVDLFTVIMSLDLQPDITCDRQISAADSAALALDWNREWLIPASTNAWFPVKIFKDVAMSGIYTVTAPTNIAVRYNGVVLTSGGETVSFPQSQSQETLEVQAAAPGPATLTISFTGTGTATNYNCSTYVNIKAWGVELDDGGVNTGIPELDGINAYAPGSRRTGFANGTNVWQTVAGSTSPQTVDISLPSLGTESEIARIELTLTEVSQLPGWCVNGRFLSGSQTGDDFSFAAGDDLRTITFTTEAQSNHGNSRQIGVSSARLKLFCKDTGGSCVLTAKPYDGDNVLLGTVTVAIPLDVNNNGIADAWERDKIVEHNGVYPGAPLTWSPALFADTGGDDEPAALGNRRTDGSYSHADTGDGLTVFQEYRGYEVDGGAGFTSARHIRLSPALKELLVQVAEQDSYTSDIGTGDVINPSAVQTYNLAVLMQSVAQFYSHSTRGAGIDLYWVRTSFSMPTMPYDYDDGEHVDNLYHHVGTIEYVPTSIFPSNLTVSGGSVWIWRDLKLLREDDRINREYFSLGDNTNAFPKATSILIKHNRNDEELKDFVKVILPSRTGMRLRDSATGNSYCRMESGGHAQALFNASPTIFQGAHVDVVNIAEENYVQLGVHYSTDTFINVVKYSVAHEGFHVIGGRHQNPEPPGTGSLIQPFLPLDDITISSSELQEINLKERISVIP